MVENAPTIPAAPVANQDVKNEEVVGKPKESVATKDVVVEEAPIVPVAKKKIKWGDSEREVSFDEAVQLAQKAFGIEEKAKTHAQKVAAAENILNMLQSDYKGFAKQCKAVGIDPQKLATEIVYEQIRLNSLSPEQRELEEYKEKEAEAAKLQKETEEAAKQAEIGKKTQEWAVQFEKDLQKALAEKKLPMSRLSLALAAQYIDAGLAQKKEYTVEQVLPYVIRDLKNIHTQTLGSLEGEDLLNYLGEDISNKVALARVARYKKGGAAIQQTATPKKETSPAKMPDRLKGLKGRAYFRELSRIKTEQGIGVFPGEEQ